MNLRTPLRVSVIAVILAVLAAAPALAVQLHTAQSIESTEGIATAAHPLAAAAGAEILAKGGNAVDAAVAVAYALAVVEPYASNIGGEGFVVISLADGTETAIDYRSRAPIYATVYSPDEFGSPTYGIYSTAIPGMVKGTEKALLQYGTMTMAEVLEPAIRLAEEGFEVDERLAQNISTVRDAFLTDYPEAAEVFLPSGDVPEVGSIFRNPDLAHSLRLIAQHGSDAFYRGEIAYAIEEATDYWIDYDSLGAYEAIERDVVRGTYKGYEIISAPPIAAGVHIIKTLNILENIDLTPYSSINDPMVAHIFAEALKLSVADYNAYVWDPDFVDVPVAGLTSKQYAKERAALLSMDRAQVYPAGDPFSVKPESSVSLLPEVEQSPSTTHVSVLDKYGNAVSLTQTLSSFWGSRVIVPGYGFFLSNHFRYFSRYNAAEPDQPNYVEPLKTTKTVLAPTIMKKDGQVRFVVGSPGGARIPQTVVQTLVAMIDFGMDVEAAMRAPKLFVQGLSLELEGGYPVDALFTLLDLGHDVQLYGMLNQYFGGLNVIAVEDDGTMIGVGSVRREGGASAPAAVEEKVAVNQ